MSTDYPIMVSLSGQLRASILQQHLARHGNPQQSATRASRRSRVQTTAQHQKARVRGFGRENSGDSAHNADLGAGRSESPLPAGCHSSQCDERPLWVISRLFQPTKLTVRMDSKPDVGRLVAGHGTIVIQAHRGFESCAVNPPILNGQLSNLFCQPRLAVFPALTIGVC